jgi:hypothetical protein
MCCQFFCLKMCVATLKRLKTAAIDLSSHEPFLFEILILLPYLQWKALNAITFAQTNNQWLKIEPLFFVGHFFCRLLH